MPVTLQEHFDIHLSQKDYGACQAILARMNGHNKEVIKEMASKFQRSLLDTGKHNFQKLSKTERVELSKVIGYKTLEEKKGIHKLNADPIRHKEVSSAAGKKARDMKKGFHDPTKNGYNYVRNTVWWTNTDTKQRKRSHTSPGPEWVRGMK